MVFLTLMQSQPTLLIQRLQAKKGHLNAYTRLAHGLFDRLALWLLAWNRFNVYQSRPNQKEKQCKCPFIPLGGKSVHLHLGGVNHLAILDELLLQDAYDLSCVDFTTDLILDVGAHIGLFSLLAAINWPETVIWAFEPHPSNAKWVCLNASRNRLRATIVDAAVSSHAGWASSSLGNGKLICFWRYKRTSRQSPSVDKIYSRRTCSAKNGYRR
jgi:hypothetical protein